MCIIPLLAARPLSANQTNLSVSQKDTILPKNDTSFVKQVNLDEIKISASFLPERHSPLRLKSISQSEIMGRSAAKTYPELIGSIPGVFATSESGSYGDAKINIRGFKQENISVMLNGIPISGLTTGNMYWNNWAGLSDATTAIQVQKGPGASMLSDNSMGGTINILTTTPGDREQFSASASFTDYGLRKYKATYGTGLLKGGWAGSLSLSFVEGKSFIQVSDVNSWAYLLNISKKMGTKQSLLITLLGSPERHKQRSSRLSAQEVKEFGTSYNKNWGYYNGKPRTISENFYHKPYLTIHHFYNISEKTLLNTALYLSTGDGGGRWSETKGSRVADIQKEGYIDWERVISTNRNPQTGESERVLTNYLAGHLQTGLKISLNTKSGNKLSLENGLHYQYYTTWEKEVITDLLGGDYWYEEYGSNPYKTVGSEIRINGGKIQSHTTLYSMATFDSKGRGSTSPGNINLKAGISLMGNNIQRYDKYNYPVDPYSKKVFGKGFSFKTGALIKLSASQSAYLNGAIYSRIPYPDVYFSSWNNNITKGVRNENNFLAEAGYRITGRYFSAELTAYLAYWKNKSLISNPYVVPESGLNRYMVSGLDALHRGLELDFEINPSARIAFKGFASLAAWNWKNDVTATIHDNYTGEVITSLNIYTHGLPVGDAPQNQFWLSATYKPLRSVSINADFGYYDRFFADFEPQNRTDSQNRSVYRIPGYAVVNAGAEAQFKLFGHRASIVLNLSNLTNNIHIERGIDGNDHTLNSFRGYWSNGFSADIGIRISR